MHVKWPLRNGHLSTPYNEQLSSPQSILITSQNKQPYTELDCWDSIILHNRKKHIAVARPSFQTLYELEKQFAKLHNSFAAAYIWWLAIETSQQWPPLYNGQNAVPQWCPFYGDPLYMLSINPNGVRFMEIHCTCFLLIHCSLDVCCILTIFHLLTLYNIIHHLYNYYEWDISVHYTLLCYMYSYIVSIIYNPPAHLWQIEAHPPSPLLFS